MEVLVIEDNEDDFVIAEKLLKEWRNDVEITWVKTIGEAIWTVETRPKSAFERIYLDPGLPDVNKTGAVDKAFQVLIGTGKVDASNIIVVSGGRWSPEAIARVSKQGGQYINKDEAFGSSHVLPQLMLGLQQDREISRLQGETNAQIGNVKEMLRGEIQQIAVNLAHLRAQCDENGRRIEKLTDKTSGPHILAIREAIAELKAHATRDRKEIEDLSSRLGGGSAGLASRIFSIEALAQGAKEATVIFDARMKTIEDKIRIKNADEVITLEKIKSSGQLRIAIISAIVTILTAAVPLTIVLGPKMFDQWTGNSQKSTPQASPSPKLSAE